MAEQTQSTIEIDGETFTLDFGSNMQARVEAADGADRAYFEIIDEFLKHPTARTGRMLLKATLLPQDKVNDEIAGLALDAGFGGYLALATALSPMRKPKAVA